MKKANAIHRFDEAVSGLLKLGVFEFRLLVDRNLGICIFPQREEILIGSAGLGAVTLQSVSRAKPSRSYPCAVFATVAAIGPRVMRERLSLTSKTLARTSLIPIEARRGRCSFRKSFAELSSVNR